jgi:hypothetical protein
MRQLNDESKPVYKVGFIREKGKATAGVKAGVFNGHFNSELGGLFSLAMDSWTFSGELVWFAP